MNLEKRSRGRPPIKAKDRRKARGIRLHPNTWLRLSIKANELDVSVTYLVERAVMRELLCF